MKEIRLQRTEKTAYVLRELDEAGRVYNYNVKSLMRQHKAKSIKELFKKDIPLFKEPGSSFCLVKVVETNKESIVKRVGPSVTKVNYKYIDKEDCYDTVGISKEKS